MNVNPGMSVGTGAHTVRMAKSEYADDAALIDEDAGQATARITTLAAGSIADAAMIISTKKSKVMHIHQTTRPENAHGALVRRGPYAAITRRLLDRQSRQVKQETRS